MKKISAIFIFLCFPLVLLSLPKDENKVEVFEKQFLVDSSRPVSLEFRDIDGNLLFSPSPDDSVHLTVEKVVRGRDSRRAERLLRDTEVRFSQRDNSLNVEIKYPKLRGLFFWFRDAQRVRVSTTLLVPVNTHMTCRLVDGSVTGDKIRGDMDVTTVDGSIRLIAIEGSFKVKTTDGRIVLQDVGGEVEARTTDGDIIVSGTAKKIRLETIDGDISLRIAAASRMSSDWNIRAVDGNVDLFLPDDFSADIYLQSSDGKITCQVPLSFTESLEEWKISGRLNEGGSLVTVKTTDGDIALKRLTSD